MRVATALTATLTIGLIGYLVGTEDAALSLVHDVTRGLRIIGQLTPAPALWFIAALVLVLVLPAARKPPRSEAVRLDHLESGLRMLLVSIGQLTTERLTDRVQREEDALHRGHAGSGSRS